MLWHTGNLPYQCHICNKKFLRPGLFKKHYDICSEKHNSNLGEDKDFENSKIENKEDNVEIENLLDEVSELIEDQVENSINDKENRFSCQICHVIFFSEKSLTKHERSHKSRHSCKFCNQNFKSKSALFDHTGNLKHCENCEKKFICPG